jgi:DNA replication protein DnaC
MDEPRDGTFAPEPTPLKRPLRDFVNGLGLRAEDTGEVLTFEARPAQPTMEDLLLLAPTATVVEALGKLAEMLASIPEEQAIQRGRLAAERGRLTAMLDRCRHRDEVAKGRPEGCWCLGQGGRYRAYLPDGTVTWKSSRQLPGGGIAPLPDAFCSCQDGERAKSEAVAALAEYGKQAALRRTEARLQAAWGGETVPRAYGDFTLAGYGTFVARHLPEWGDYAVQIAETLTKTMDVEGMWVVLSGRYGCGKTALAIGCVRLAIERGQTALFVVVPNLLAKLRATYDRREGGPREDDLLADLAKVDVLVLDDLGKEQLDRHSGTVSGWVRERLFMVINGRYSDDEKRTIVTSNLSLEDLADRLGDEAITDRIRQRARGALITVETPSLRTFADGME